MKKVLVLAAITALVLFLVSCDVKSDVPSVTIWSASWPDISIPSLYDGRSVGRAVKPEDQEDLAACWAFSSLEALEISLLPESDMRFSKDHMIFKNGFGFEPGEGGNSTMSSAYLLSWTGPVKEADDPYRDGYSPDNLQAEVHVQEIRYLEKPDSQRMKEAILLYGAVAGDLYMDTEHFKNSTYYRSDTCSYYYDGDEESNHGIVIIGWDDAYPAAAFSHEPGMDGAYLCMTSWGKNFGDDGFFYVSYEDSHIGDGGIVYSLTEPVDTYDHIYQSDLCGWTGQAGFDSEECWFKNVYHTAEAEELSAAGFYATAQNTSYELYIERHADEGTRILLAQGELSDPGYYTVKLDQPVLLDEEERFALVVKVLTPGVLLPAAVENQSNEAAPEAVTDDGEGYLSPDGKDWISAEKEHSNICLKAYTKETK